jgi:hypothetical protein
MVVNLTPEQEFCDILDKKRNNLYKIINRKRTFF